MNRRERPRITEGFVRAGSVTEVVLKRYGITPENMAIFGSIWDKELGKLSRRIELLGRKGGCLIARASEPVYGHELILRKREIIKKINGHFGRKVIDDIRVVR